MHVGFPTTSSCCLTQVRPFEHSMGAGFAGCGPGPLLRAVCGRGPALFSIPTQASRMSGCALRESGEPHTCVHCLALVTSCIWSNFLFSEPQKINLLFFKRKKKDQIMHVHSCIKFRLLERYKEGILLLAVSSFPVLIILARRMSD